LNREHVGAQGIESSAVGIGSASDRDIDRGALTKHGKQFGTHELAQPALESVAIDRRVLVPGYDDADARSGKRGSKDPDVEVHGPNSLPLSNDRL
jgi:hypothetical protein